MNQIELLDEQKAPQIALELGLSEKEYEQLLKTQGRVPSLTELYMYSLMWSEHCSYKHSKNQLRKFSSEGSCVLQGPGENAGVVSLGDGWALAFKMESHNHPSAIEPFQGAATGVGGIMRDIFTMGARPVASLNSLRFGTLDKARQRYLLEGSVSGIGFYGNCLGVPTVGGEVYFDEAYEGNCLINAMGVGLMREEDLTRAVGSGPGNLVVIMGSTTGRDGIGGASTLASQEFDEAAENKRPAVQVGDPFEEKLLIEVCLELLRENKFVALGDLGAAGLTSSASEMASRGGVGIDIDVTKVPQREPNMKPFEIMVSESQERMLAVVTPENLESVKAVCDKWGVRHSVIGEITDTGRFVVREGSTVVADMPAAKLADDAPRYSPEYSRPAYLDELQAFDVNALTHPDSQKELEDIFFKLLSSPNLCSRQWIYEQYDQQVQANTAVLPSLDAGVIRIADHSRDQLSNKGVAMTTDCNGRYCYINPRRGAQIAVCEAARNVVAKGARPLAITDCLNFGSPEKPEVFYTFVEAIEGMSEACKSMNLPVVSGNVSFYNESFGKPIYPTPSVGLVGLIDNLDTVVASDFSKAGEHIILVGQSYEELGGSEYVKQAHSKVAGDIPALDIDLEKDTHEAILEAADNKLLNACHDVSEGGVAISLAEMCLKNSVGINVSLPDDISKVARLFSESQSRFIVSLDKDKVEAFEDILEKHQVPFSAIGTTEGSRFVIEDLIDVSIEDISQAYSQAFSNIME